jgi:hypothetical protein
VKTLKFLNAAVCLLVSVITNGQVKDKSASVSLFTGIVNYQGDLKPNSITLNHSGFSAGLFYRKPLTKLFAIRAGVNYGTIRAADEWNREYLKPRNLSFTTTIKEAYAGLELAIFDIAAKRFTPYLYGGIAVFHFNPWANDASGTKIYLQPLSTEGQGLPQYPDKRPYKLTNIALPFGGGFRFALSGAVDIGIELSQRKTFTDYLDDVSGSYVDRNALFQAKGAKAVEMAYRGGQIPLGSPLYPAHGEQRGTPTESDWYYFGGITIGIKLDDLKRGFKKDVASMKCPKF